jgi:hypothetical protein
MAYFRVVVHNKLSSHTYMEENSIAKAMAEIRCIREYSADRTMKAVLEPRYSSNPLFYPFCRWSLLPHEIFQTRQNTEKHGQTRCGNKLD